MVFSLTIRLLLLYPLALDVRAAADIGLSMAMADAYMVSLLAAHDVAGRPLGGSADSQTPPHPSHHAHARAPRRENDKLAPLWYECAGQVPA